MGICSSCLGFGRRQQREEEEDDSETRGLLYDDPYRGGRYGAVNDALNSQRAAPYQQDPESVRRERETLDGICHAMSDNIIDVFVAQPQISGPYGIITPQPKIEYSKSKDSDRDPASLSLRTIKKGRGGPVFSNNGDGVLGLRAVQDAIG